jgi:hypothetical protein
MRSSVRVWVAAPLLALFLIAAGLEANTTRQNLYHELQLPHHPPASSLDLALYLTVDQDGDAVVPRSGADAAILHGQPLSIWFRVANEGEAPQTAIEDSASPAGRIRIAGLVRGSAQPTYLAVTWTSPQPRNGAHRNAGRNDLSLPAGSSVGWTGTVVGGEDLAPGVYELMVERTIKDSGGRPARMHTGPLTLEVKAASGATR